MEEHQNHFNWIMCISQSSGVIELATLPKYIKATDSSNRP